MRLRRGAFDGDVHPRARAGTQAQELGRAAAARPLHRTVFVLPSFAGGGAERVLLALAGALDRARFEAEIVVLDGRGPLVPPAGITIHDLGRPRLRHALGPLRAVLRGRKPNSILSTMGYLNLAVLGMAPVLAGRPRLIVREANLPVKSIEAMRWPALARLAYRMLYPRADAVLCNARVVADALSTEARVPSARLHILDNPVDGAAIRAGLVPVREPGPGPRFVA
ncbi:MAG: glycosyltransferase, partial [Alphaproteobacteria bacterium]|nr:glycosyltransferase [Alphaproteobacteria bacterium]